MYSSPCFRAVVAGRNVYKCKKSTWVHKVVSFHFQNMKEDGICGGGRAVMKFFFLLSTRIATFGSCMDLMGTKM